MAKGWESKAVEEQIEQAGREPSDATAAWQSPAMLARKQRADALRMMRSQLLNQLSALSAEGHRHRVEASLRAIEDEIAALG